MGLESCDSGPNLVSTIYKCNISIIDCSTLQVFSLIELGSGVKLSSSLSVYINNFNVMIGPLFFFFFNHENVNNQNYTTQHTFLKYF